MSTVLHTSQNDIRNGVLLSCRRRQRSPITETAILNSFLFFPISKPNSADKDLQRAKKEAAFGLNAAQDKEKDCAQEDVRNR